MKIRTLESKAYRIVLEISDQLRTSSFERTVVKEKYTINGLLRNSTEHSALSVRDLEWTCVEWRVLDKLTNPAMLFIIKHIVPTMKLYNMLWHRPVSRKSSEVIIMKELVDNVVLYRTEVPGIYLINPIKLWRGNPIIAAEETKELLRIHRKPSLDIIVDRRPGSKEYTHHNGEETMFLNGPNANDD